MTARRVRTITWRRSRWPWIYIDRDPHLGTELFAGWLGRAVVINWGGDR